MKATVKAVETVDECLGRIYDHICSSQDVMLVCSSHGKAEEMYDDKTEAPILRNTMNPVPCILVNYGDKGGLKPVGSMADIAPTLLEIMGLPCPKEMTGKSLII